MPSTCRKLQKWSTLPVEGQDLEHPAGRGMSKTIGGFVG